MAGTKSVTDFKTELQHSVLELLWRQWAALGVAAHHTPTRNDYAIDPEALLLFSSVFCRHDQRLYDLAAAWLIEYGLLLNPVRLRTLLRKNETIEPASLAYLSALRMRTGDKRWGPLAGNTAASPAAPAPMFYDAAGNEIAYCPEPDSLAAQYGFLRSAFRKHNKILTLLPETSATQLLRIRSLVGVSARADVLFQLMIHPCSISQLAAHCHFARSAIIAVLEELQTGNLVTPVPVSSGRKAYMLISAEKLRKFFHTQTCSFIDWQSIYSCILKLWLLLSDPLLAQVSETTSRGELLLFFRQHIRPAFLHCGIPALQQLSETSIQTLPEILHKC